MTVKQPPEIHTVDSFEEYIARPENDDRRFELINGKVVEKVPTEAHGTFAATIAAHLYLYKQQHGGRVTVEGRYRPEDDIRNDRLPDVSFTTAEHMEALVTDGAVLHMPDLAVELQSKNQSDEFMLKKARYYLDNGAGMVWIIYRDHRVRVLTQTTDEFIAADQVIDGGSVLPDFSIAVRDIFAD